MGLRTALSGVSSMARVRLISVVTRWMLKPDVTPLDYFTSAGNWFAVQDNVNARSDY
ncbi:MAG: hypothetical protein AAF557_11750 [Pseudomonadota bacterium]